MSLEPYSACPCGSGKKFKWCCQPIHEQIDKAYQQHNDGQHETALRTIDEAVRLHSDKAEAWGRKAHLLHLNGKNDEAEKALEEAFRLDKNYAFGYLLQGMFRASEGESIGALMLFRKAAELYSAEAEDQRAFLYDNISNIELQRGNAVAARYAMSQARNYHANDPEFSEAWDESFGAKSRLPEAVRKDYRLMGDEANRPPVWKQAVIAGRFGRLAEAEKAFVGLTTGIKVDPAAWFNIGLIRAWQGNNRGAIDALNEYVQRERDEAKAVDAWALSEALRLGDSMKDLSDYVQHTVSFRFSDGNAVSAILEDWQRSGRLIGVRVDEERGLLTGLVLEEVSQLIGAAAAPAAPLGSHLAVFSGVVSIWHVNTESLAKIANEVEQQLGARVVEKRASENTPNIGDLTIEAMLFPTYGQSPQDLVERISARAAHYFEETWANRPLKSLENNTPTTAAKNPLFRRKVLGAIRFLEQCFLGNAPRRKTGDASEAMQVYDFDRLRKQLGLDQPAGALPAPTLDLSGLSAKDLSSLDIADLSFGETEQAFRAAVKLEAREQALRFVQSLISRPTEPEKEDLFPFFKYLIDQAQTQANWDNALQYTIQGEQLDAERNQGRRRNDYELRRGQLLAKRGDAAKAAEAFDALINRAPNELKLRGSAAEAMLSLRQGAHARRFADAGLDEAKRAGNRDMEAYFQELVAAAKKQGG